MTTSTHSAPTRSGPAGLGGDHHRSLARPSQPARTVAVHPVDRSPAPTLGARATALARLDARTRAVVVAGLQQNCGNRSVQRLLAEGRRGDDFSGRGPIRRCGATPCDCPADERAGHAVARLLQRDDEGDEQQAGGGGSVFDGVVDTVSGVVEGASGAVSGDAGQAAESAPGVTGTAGDAIATGVETLTEGASQVAGGASQLAEDAVETVADGIEAAGGAAGGIAGGIAGGETGEDVDGGAVADVSAADVAGRKDEGRGQDAFCKPFSDSFRTLTVLGEMGFIVPKLMSAAFGGGVAGLWTQFIKGGAAPQELTDPDIVSAFADSSTSTGAAESVADAAKDAVEAQPALADGVVDLQTLVGPGRLNAIGRGMDFNDPFSKPGNIAGGVSTPPQTSALIGAKPGSLDDSRTPGGSAVVTTQANGTRTIVVSPRFTVVDTVDFCPGGAGAFIEQTLTVPLSQLEASGVSGDVPFTVRYGTPALTRTASKPASR